MPPYSLTPPPSSPTALCDEIAAEAAAKARLPYLARNLPGGGVGPGEVGGALAAATGYPVPGPPGAPLGVVSSVGVGLVSNGKVSLTGTTVQEAAR